ncbi:leucine-rich repeat-containing protein 72 [Amazona ochrocephala]
MEAAPPRGSSGRGSRLCLGRTWPGEAAHLRERLRALPGPGAAVYYADKCTVYCQAVEKQLKNCGFKRTVDVLVLYLAGQVLFMGYLRKPDNQFNKVAAWDNLIFGALKHLCVLQVLFLHNNQLKNLGKTVKGLKGMISLQTLSNTLFLFCRTASNLFHNPLAQDPDYWLCVIHLLPSGVGNKMFMCLLTAVTQRERESALHLYQYERSGVMQSVAFGKRVDTPLETTVVSSRCTQPARRVMMPSGIYTNIKKSIHVYSEFGNQRNNSKVVRKLSENGHFLCSFCREPFENPEDAVLLRAMARSVMEFSYVDWNNVATSQERQLENKAAAEVCKKLTVQFR